MEPEHLHADDELGKIEGWAREDQRGNIGQQAAARRTLRLVKELRHLRSLLGRVYQLVEEVKGTKDLQAELGCVTGHLGVIGPAGGDSR